MDAATILAGEIDVPTGSGFIPTAGPPATIISTGSEVGPTASPIVTRRKGKEVMVESDTPKKKKLQEQINAQVVRELKEQQEKEDIRMNEQIARNAEVARIHAEEEIQGMIESLDKSNETIAKYLQEYQEFASELPLEKKIELISDLVKYQEHYTKVHKFQSQQRRPITKKQKREYYMAVIKSNLGWRFKDFKGSKEETERLKRKGLNLEKEQVKKQKSSEEAPEIETSTEEFTEEKMKEMMQLVPVEDVYVQALQVKHPIIDWKVEDFIPMGSKEETERLKRKCLNLENEQVKKQKSSEEAPEIETSTEEFTEEKMKEMMQLVLVEDVYVQALQVKHPIIDWKVHTEEWKLYDLSGVHHLTAKDREIFMLVEKDYPLTKGLALVMISYKLQVENYSQMAEDLIRKIYNIANTPRQQGD
uniref:Uncharacterized protein n=1 Tax=Tanacetum cinerariifolium TaxID=118510 RepID=A0A699HW95_TANCI|nr:hypothetical protein [Tanacetum cinerariifolium]